MKKLDKSIEERPKEINSRKEFGHGEYDLVLGHKTKDDEVLLTLSERTSREFQLSVFQIKHRHVLWKPLRLCANNTVSIEMRSLKP